MVHCYWNRRRSCHGDLGRLGQGADCRPAIEIVASRARFCHVTCREEQRKDVECALLSPRGKEFTGLESCNGVRVLVVGLARRRSDSSYIAEPLVSRLQLTWAFPEFHELFPTITDGTETCDLGYLDGSAVEHFRLSTYIAPATFPGYVGRNDALRVTLVASAHNGQSNTLIVEISWDGIWREGEGEMQKHLVVKDVSPSGSSLRLYFL